MHGSVINVLKNVDQTQSILPCLPHDGGHKRDKTNQQR
jgi:hypothetical protein